eukprot:CAMPEP_0170604598 /NCGR_PEP_ID=MMETSP0224-20130122/19510_1 /TAXON_ID=285029 /ORGANISM="Togula jolla, Strain CCCM 725" /LENGTH=635 /DNA_ID=CAMNT_0010929515 /DNA_START=899 /DNA_END=2807 /DNA_ORIENTATION=-
MISVKAAQMLRQEVVIQIPRIIILVNLVKGLCEVIQRQARLTCLTKSLQGPELHHESGAVRIAPARSTIALNFTLVGRNQSRHGVSDNSHAVSAVHELLLPLLVPDKLELRHAFVLPPPGKHVVDILVVRVCQVRPVVPERPRIDEVQHSCRAALCTTTRNEVVFWHVVEKVHAFVQRLPLHLSFGSFGWCALRNVQGDTVPKADDPASPGHGPHHGKHDGNGENVKEGGFPPELFRSTYTHLAQDPRAQKQWQRVLAAGDAWSAGIVIYVMLSGDLPYCNSRATCSGTPPDFSAEVWRDVSACGMDIINKLVVDDVEERMTLSQALKHQWLTSQPSGPGTDSSDDLDDDRTCNLSPSGGCWAPFRSARSPGSSHADGKDLEYRIDVAQRLLVSLKAWRKMPKLRRIAIAAIAKRLQGDHACLRFPETAFRLFNGNGKVLKTGDLVKALHETLGEAAFNELPAESPTVFAEAEAVRPETHSITGFNMRDRIRSTFRMSSPILEDTPSSASRMPSTPGSTPVLRHEEGGLTSLKRLVDSLDGRKKGRVDYTLLVACLMPASVYTEERRVLEIFEQFDLSKRGLIGAEDLRRALLVKESSLQPFRDMIAAFDLNDDGVLNPEEFLQMLGQQEVKPDL